VKPILQAAKEINNLTRAAGGLFSSGLGKLKGSFFGGTEKETPVEVTPAKKEVKAAGKAAPLTLRISKTLAQNIIFNTMSQFLPYFV
jgi:hypothetical protein